jgi:hypothetical protein
MNPLDKNRNPIIIPTEEPKKPGCPKCGGQDFSGRRIGGAASLHFSCRGCGNQWDGGLPHVPMDPREPRPPENPLKTGVTFTKNDKGMVVEEVRGASLTPEFRKGAPIPPPGEEEDG